MKKKLEHISGNRYEIAKFYRISLEIFLRPNFNFVLGLEREEEEREERHARGEFTASEDESPKPVKGNHLKKKSVIFFVKFRSEVKI